MSDAGKRLTTYMMLGASLQFPPIEYAECTCGHYEDTEHSADGLCLVTGCGCEHGRVA